MSKRTEELEQEDFLYALYDTQSKTFLRVLCHVPVPCNIRNSPATLEWFEATLNK